MRGSQGSSHTTQQTGMLTDHQCSLTAKAHLQQQQVPARGGRLCLQCRPLLLRRPQLLLQACHALLC